MVINPGLTIFINPGLTFMRCWQSCDAGSPGLLLQRSHFVNPLLLFSTRGVAFTMDLGHHTLGTFEWSQPFAQSMYEDVKLSRACAACEQKCLEFNF